MKKREDLNKVIRARVNSMLDEYEGTDYAQLLNSIKEEVDKIENVERLKNKYKK